MEAIDPCGSLSWEHARSFLPLDLDGLAVSTGALERRRGVKGGESLLRTMLLYGLPKSTLALASRLARESHLAQLSPEALFKRLSKAEPMLRSTFFHLLQHASGPELLFAGYRLLSVDASSLCGPGATGTNQRLHVVYDLGKGLPLSLDLTDARGGETLARHDSFGWGDLVLGDRGYGQGRGLTKALRSGARLLVRFEFQSLRLLSDYDEKIWPEQAELCVPDSGCVEICVYLPDWPAPLRAIGERNPKGEVVWLLTDLSLGELAPGQARSLYARRWQIELFFKRLKSLLDLDELPSRDGPMARPWVWAKLILAALAVLITHERFSPWGRPLETSAEHVEGVPIRSSDPSRDAAQRQSSKAPPRPAKRSQTAKRRANPAMSMETIRGLS